MQNTIENSRNTLTNLLNQVQDQAARSADFLVPTNQAQFKTNDNAESKIILEANQGMPTTELRVNNVAFNQIANKAGIDVRTAGRLREGYATEFDGLINAIWEKESSQRMLRTFLDSDQTHGECRAFVSDKFKTFDNHHLLNAALPQLMESEAQWQVVTGQVTDQRMYLRLKSQAITGSGAALNDLMALGIGLSNSETGCGSVQVFQMFWTLACLNGMQTENRHRSSHITGSRADSDVWGMLTNEAKDADNKALELKVRDLVTGYASRESFDNVLEQFKLAAADTVQGGATETVQSLGTVLKLSKKDTTRVLDGLLATIGQAGYSGNPINRATLVNAVTAVANSADADECDDWQKLGGRVLTLPRADWARVSQAA